MKSDFLKLKNPPIDHPTFQFGEGGGFQAQFYNGWLTAICGGGTGFAIKAKNLEEAVNLLQPLMNLEEYDVIRHCNKTKDWWKFDYYEWRLIPGVARIHCYDFDSKFIETVQ